MPAVLDNALSPALNMPNPHERHFSMPSNSPSNLASPRLSIYSSLDAKIGNDGGSPFSLPSRLSPAASGLSSLSPFIQSADMSEMSALMYQRIVATSSSAVATPAGTSTVTSGPSDTAVDAVSDFDFQTNCLSPGHQRAQTQAEREEELLLNFLITRRRQQMLSSNLGFNVSTVPNDYQCLADDLLRLRREYNQTILSQHTMDNVFSSTYFRGQESGHFDSPATENISNMSLMTPAALAMNLSYRAAYDVQKNESPQSSLESDNLERIEQFLSVGHDASTPDRQGLDMNNSASSNISGKGKRSFDEMKMETEMKMDPTSAESKVHALSNRHILDKQSDERNAFPHDHLNQMKAYDPPVKRKRLQKKKPADMPRRPLSAYNLFFSEERDRILHEIETEEKGLTTSAESLIAVDGSKPKALLRPLLPSENARRKHRKTHGKISFRQLATLVGQRWKKLSTEKRQYYKDLAQEDTKRQKKAMEEYYQKQLAIKST